MNLSITSNLMGIPTHLICHLITYSVFTAVFSIHLSSLLM